MLARYSSSLPGWARSLLVTGRRRTSRVTIGWRAARSLSNASGHHRGLCVATFRVHGTAGPGYNANEHRTASSDHRSVGRKVRPSLVHATPVPASSASIFRHRSSLKPRE